MVKKKIYVASSWRNQYQPQVVSELRTMGFEVYDFRHPTEDNNGFHWSKVDEDWQNWTPERYRTNLDHPISKSGFANDWNAMENANIGVLVLPSGRSAHIEAGYFIGALKPLFIFLPEKQEPELMYKMADKICLNIEELKSSLQDL